jgi:hypothetical protein
MKRIGVIAIVGLVIAMVGCLAFSGVRALSSKGSAGTDKSTPTFQGVPGYVELGPRGEYVAGSFKVIRLTPMAIPRSMVTPTPKVTK